MAGPNNWILGRKEKTIKRNCESEFLSLAEATEGFYRAFTKNQLKYVNGRKVRTNIPRKIPMKKDFDFTRKEKRDG